MDLAVALRAFLRTVERGSVTAAARDLGVSQPAVTKHLRNLEQHVGARLLERSARLVRPTPQGQTLYELSRSALATIDSALEGVRRDMQTIEGPLRIHAPSCIGSRHLHGVVLAFRDRYPGVTVDLVLENRTIDLVHENYDIALHYGRPAGQDLIIRRIGFVRRILVASPDFLKRIGPIVTPARLGEIDMVMTASPLAPRDRLTLFADGEPWEVMVRPVLRTNDAQALIETLLAGHAAGVAQRLLVVPHLANGRLVQILPEYQARPTEAFLVYPSVRFMRPAVRAFTDFAAPRLQAIDGVDAHGPAFMPASLPVPTTRADAGDVPGCIHQHS